MARTRRSLPVPAIAGLLLAGCGLQTSGLPPTGGAGTTSTSSATSASTGSTTTSTTTTSTTGGTGGTGGATTTTSAAGGGGTGGATTGSGGSGGTGGAPPVTAYPSCLDRLAAEPGSPSGVYPLLDGGGQVYQAYCEMVADGGGWTLALKIDGSKSTFEYQQGIWTDTNALAADHPALDATEAKLPSTWSVPFGKLRLGMVDAGVFRWLVVSVSGASLRHRVSSGGDFATKPGVGAWEGLLASGSLQTKCTWEGVDANDRVRIGIVGDESGNCGSPDSVIGFGIHNGIGSGSCGNFAYWGPDHGDRTTPTFGYVMVR